MPTSVEPIQFIDLQAQRQPIAKLIEASIGRALEHGQFILGPEVYDLEKALKEHTGAKHVVSCASGTDALTLLLMTKDIKAGDAVFVPTFTFAATAEVVAQLGATPIFVDICKTTFNIEVESLKKAYTVCKEKQLNPKGIIAVDLFGLPADYPAINEFAKNHNLWVIADSAQSYGAKQDGKKMGAIATMTATSFFPAKPLGCYGDGGAIFVEDEQLAEKLRSLRGHGSGADRYDHIYIGLNSRLDTFQAAILLEKLKIFDQEHKRRLEIADFYEQHLKDLAITPQCPANSTSAWAIYTLRVNPNQRDLLADALNNQAIPSAVYYRKPLHLQMAYQHFPRAEQSLKNAEQLSKEVISIPMHPYLSDQQLAYIVNGIKQALK